ncbi:hypothetical protein, partial [Nocardia sp. 852002-51101_SCH5132738]|uniref:hypothetical protein n=1 Tax=Nocardia sp. 852002-51101_SCH5132738 TaxID=1834095 RepID=UPI000ACC9DD0
RLVLDDHDTVHALDTESAAPITDTERGAPLTDQEGQPGITGPIPNTDTPTTPDQPGVSPPG